MLNYIIECLLEGKPVEWRFEEFEIFAYHKTFRLSLVDAQPFSASIGFDS